MIAARRGKAILEVQSPLARLMRRLEGAEAVISHPQPLPDFDLCCPLLSLPLFFRNYASEHPGRHTIPAGHTR